MKFPKKVLLAKWWRHYHVTAICFACIVTVQASTSIIKNEEIGPVSLFLNSDDFGPGRQPPVATPSHGTQFPPSRRGVSHPRGRDNLHPKIPTRGRLKMKKEVIRPISDGKIEKEELEGIVLLSEEGSNEVFVPRELIQTASHVLTKVPRSLRHVKPSLPPIGGAGEARGQAARHRLGTKPLKRHVTGRMMRGMPFTFQYIVDDERTNNFQTRQEEADADGVVRGCYQVLEPTGMVRTVTYMADSNGFRVMSITNGPDKVPCSVAGDKGRPSPFQRDFSKNLRGSAPLLNNYNQRSVDEDLALNRWSSNSHQQTRQDKAFTESSRDLSEFSTLHTKSDHSKSFIKERSENHSNFNAGFSHQVQSDTQTKNKSEIDVIQSTKDETSYDQEKVETRKEWMANYINELSESLLNTFRNITTQTSTDTSNAVNFPFVLIPIASFLKLRERGLIDKSVQGFGAVIQPARKHASPKTVKKVVTNVYNSQIKNTKQTKTKEVASKTNQSYKVEQKNKVNNSHRERVQRDFKPSPKELNTIQIDTVNKLRNLVKSASLNLKNGTDQRPIVFHKVNPINYNSNEEFESFQPSYFPSISQHRIPSFNTDPYSTGYTQSNVFPKTSIERLLNISSNNRPNFNVRKTTNKNLNLLPPWLKEFQSKQTAKYKDANNNVQNSTSFLSNNGRITHFRNPSSKPVNSVNSDSQKYLQTPSKVRLKNNFSNFHSQIPEFKSQLIATKVNYVQFRPKLLSQQSILNANFDEDARLNSGQERKLNAPRNYTVTRSPTPLPFNIRTTQLFRTKSSTNDEQNSKHSVLDRINFPSISKDSKRGWIPYI